MNFVFGCRAALRRSGNRFRGDRHQEFEGKQAFNDRHGTDQLSCHSGPKLPSSPLRLLFSQPGQTRPRKSILHFGQSCCPWTLHPSVVMTLASHQMIHPRRRRHTFLASMPSSSGSRPQYIDCKVAGSVLRNRPQRRHCAARGGKRQGFNRVRRPF